MKSIAYFTFLCILLTSCRESDHQTRRQNLKGEYIYRKKSEIFFTPSPPIAKTPLHYPWERSLITKEFFRCRGDSLNPVVEKKREGRESIYFSDCPGGERHGLPLRDGEEFVYPCLIDLLNYIQEKSGHKVYVTTGHRCPDHNSYCDHSPSNWGSKHMLGAEVDFYVVGMEQEPEKIISLVQQFYSETDPYKGDKAFEEFSRFHRQGLNVSTPPWHNKEIFIKLYLKAEGRDFDNQHPYPYIGIQVRYDRDAKKQVVFEQGQTQNFLRN